MRTIILFFLFISVTNGQTTFQNNIEIVNKHLHDLNITPMGNGSNDFIVSGNLFDVSMQNEELVIKRVDVNGNVVWLNKYDHPLHQLIRGFDIVLDNNIIVATGSVDINGFKKVFVISIDSNSGILINGMYYDIFDPLLNSRGLHISHTESDADGDSVPDPGYLIGGFYSDCYSLNLTCINKGFLLRTDINLNAIWTTSLDTNTASGLNNYDFINHVTETNDGFFINGSATSPGTLQSILALKVDFQGAIMWNKSYTNGNAKDLSVDSYYDVVSNSIFMLCNYSQAHYFGVTMLDNSTGLISSTNSWIATSSNNYDVYGFSIMKSYGNNQNLIVTGYDKEESWIDQDGTAQFGHNNLFVYEFEKNTGNPVSINYQYLVPHIEPTGDEFNFWNYQLPLIYYPDISFGKGINGAFYYFHVGYRTEVSNTFSEVELFKTKVDKLNNCEQLEINLTPNVLGLQDIPILYGTTTVNQTLFEPYNISLSYNEDSCPSTLSSQEVLNDQGIIYPNPVNNLLNYSGINSGYYKVYNSLGKIILEGSILDDYSINVSQLNEGVYLIQLISNDNIQSFKFIKN